VLDKLAVFAQAKQALPQADQPWFDATLRAELSQLHSVVQYEAHLTGSGAIAQGPGSVAAGERAVIIAGGVQHGVISVGNVSGGIENTGARDPSAPEPKE
jgi:hypothetical protein